MTTHVSVPSRRSRSDTWIETLVLALIGALAVAALLGGCLAEKEEVPEVVVVPTWTTLTSSGGELAQHCQSCHGSSGGLSLAADQYSAVFNQPSGQVDTFMLVEPNNSADSYLYMKMITDSRMTGLVMPTAGQLSASVTNVVRDWIDAGALEQ